MDRHRRETYKICVGQHLVKSVIVRSSHAALRIPEIAIVRRQVLGARCKGCSLNSDAVGASLEFSDDFARSFKAGTGYQNAVDHKMYVWHRGSYGEPAP
jgi:hypothetical protein